MGLLMLVARDFSLLQKFPRMNVFSRYLIRHPVLGFCRRRRAIVAAFTTFNLINELMMSVRAVMSGLRQCWWC